MRVGEYIYKWVIDATEFERWLDNLMQNMKSINFMSKWLIDFVFSIPEKCIYFVEIYIIVLII